MYVHVRAFVCNNNNFYSSVCPKAVCLCVGSEGMLLEKWAPLNGAHDNDIIIDLTIPYPQMKSCRKLRLVCMHGYCSTCLAWLAVVVYGLASYWQWQLLQL